MDPTAVTLSAEADPDALIDALLADPTLRLVAVPERTTTIRRSVIDTFDWRVVGSGRVLERERTGRRTATVLRSTDGTEQLRVDGEPPRFVWAPSDDAMCLALEPAVEMRSLGQMAEFVTERRTVALQDGEGKTRVRLVVERSRSAGRGARPAAAGSLGAIARVLPLRGYEADARRVEWLFAEAGLVSGAVDPAMAAVVAAGHTPGSYSSKLKVALEPDLPAAEAYRRILSHLLTTFEANLEGLRADTDSEFLHDARVAVRRTRSVLGQAKGVLPPALLEWAVPEFRWLGAVTSPTRDLDVWLLTLPELEVGLPELLDGAIGPMHAYIAERQREAHGELVAALDSSRGHAFLAEWAAELQRPAALEADGAPGAAAPVVHIARARIWKAYRRVLRAGRAIDDSTPGTHLHDLRKDAKKLRYLLECFAALFPPDEMRATVRELKLVQDNLGTFQDCEVQEASLVGFAEGLVAESRGRRSSGAAQAAMAMGCLVDRIEERRQQARAQFAQRFAAFDSRDNRAGYRELFGPPPSVAEGAGEEPQ